MSIKIKFERKRHQEVEPYFLRSNASVSKAEGLLFGSDVVVEDRASMANLINDGFYGSYLGQRMNFFNTSCFPNITATEFDGSDEPRPSSIGVEWLLKLNFASQQRLYLSAEEAVYLKKIDRLEVNGQSLPDLWHLYATRDGNAFKQRYKVYEHFRKQGWTVRSSVSFSGDFSLYKETPKMCHSSAIVQIVPNLNAVNSVQTIATRRHLKNVKKAFILVVLKLRDDQRWDSVDYNSNVQIEVFHSKTPLSSHKVYLFEGMCCEDADGQLGHSSSSQVVL